MSKTSNKICEYSGLATNGECVWYISPGNLLFEINILNGTSKFLGTIPYTNNLEYSFRTLIYVDDALFIFPFQAKVLVKYDLAKNKFSLIEFPKEFFKIFGNDYLNIFGGYVSQNNVIMYGTRPFIVKYDYKQSVFSWINAFEFYSFTDKDVCFWNDGFCIQKNNYYPIAKRRTIAVENETIEEISLFRWADSCEKNQTITKAYKNKICFVLVRNDWNIRVEIIDPNVPEDYKIIIDEQVESIALQHNDTLPFVCGDVVEDKLILYPAHHNDLWIVNLINGDIKKINISDGKDNYKKVKCLNSINIGNNISASILSSQNKLVVYDAVTEKLIQHRIVLDENSVERMKKEYLEIINKYGIVREESSVLSLKTFLEWV